MRTSTMMTNHESLKLQAHLDGTIIGLSKDQKKAVEDMGLESIVNMSLEGVPSKLGFYVVDALNTRNMIMDLKHGSIQITPESIHDLMGLPIGGINILDKDDIPDATRLTEEWKK